MGCILDGKQKDITGYRNGIYNMYTSLGTLQDEPTLEQILNPYTGTSAQTILLWVISALVVGYLIKR